MTGRHPLYKVSKADLERLRAARWGRVRIAKLYGCHDATVRHWLKKHGLPLVLEPIGPSSEQITAAIERGHP